MNILLQHAADLWTDRDFATTRVFAMAGLSASHPVAHEQREQLVEADRSVIVRIDPVRTLQIGSVRVPHSV